jgi:hypothetical protein
MQMTHHLFFFKKNDIGFKAQANVFGSSLGTYCVDSLFPYFFYFFYFITGLYLDK